MTALLAASLLLGLPIQSSAQKTFLDQIAGIPTGRNGYEEYLQAAEIVRDPAFSVYTSATSDGGRLDPATADPGFRSLAVSAQHQKLLAIRRAAVNRYGKALILVRRGNDKPVSDPRTNLTVDTLFPEYASFRQLGMLASMRAYVEFADGNSLAGTQTLLDQLTFSQKASGTILISVLVSSAVTALALAAFEEHLPVLSLQDAILIQKSATSLLEAPNPLTSVFEGERKFLESTLRRLSEKPEDLSYLVADNPRAQQIIDEYTTLSPAQRQAIDAHVHQSYDVLQRATIRALQQPESQWIEAIQSAETELDQDSSVGGMILNGMLPIFSQAASAIAIRRTQIRLLALHGRIIQFRWENGRLPNSLNEVATPTEQFDPLSDAPFQFEHDGTGYKLTSKGTGSTGEISLKYRRSFNETAQPKT